jgi:ADP-ribose pyrophosphatase YjhB (NUDIX family)
MMEEILKTKGNSLVATSALIVRGGRILLGLRNYTPDKWTGSFWTTPGGRCEEGESIENGLRRETEEETGITDLEIKRYLGMVDGAKEGDKVEVFLCSSNQEAQLKEPEKFGEWRWFLPNEIPENFINKNILLIISGIV